MKKGHALRERQTTERRPVGVEVAGLSKSFGRQVVLKNISLSIKQGEIFVIMDEWFPRPA